MASSFESVVGPLSAALAPMGPKVREILVSCLPEALGREVLGRLSRVEAGETMPGTPLERDLRRQALALWQGGETSHGAALGLELEDVLGLVLRRARPTVLTRALLQLPGGLPAEVLHRIASVDLARLPHHIEGDEPGVFLWRLKEALGEVRLPPAPEFAARAVRALAPHSARPILSALRRIDPAVMRTVRDLAYPFEDLMQLSDPELQMTLMGVGNRELAVSVQVTPTIVRNRILQCLSVRRRLVVEEEEALAGGVSEAASLAAQSRIVDRARLLYEEGQLHTYLGSVEDTADLVRARREAREAFYHRHLARVKKWGGRSRNARRQSVGVALGAVALLACILFTMTRFRPPDSPARSAPAAPLRESHEGRTAGRPGTAPGGAGQGSHPRGVEDAGGLRVFITPGTPDRGARADLRRTGRGRLDGGRLRFGTARVVVTDSTAGFETPLIVVSGGVGSAYRVQVAADSTTRVVALRGVLRAGPVTVSTGQEALFSPDGEVRMSPGTADAEDLGWLEKNR